ncbi:hypothetical protein BP5796_07766 [Coleophoma crateriformis]|uniref:Large ribosomal subunit protein mL50 n=1 Tax=Coleophoma crateriformis TaxID=565419 RepID=A0A3D8RCG6_9HELO|nr:hypothetical protein BP5796_07766 [Coleophoma crateriformis]
MRRISRVDRSIGLMRRSVAANNTYLCAACHQSNLFSTSSPRTLPSDGKAPFTERVRRRIWGTDSPPGLADPYGDASVFDQTKKRAQRSENADDVEARGPQTIVRDMTGYEPAATWDGLDKVGGFGGWWKENWDAENKFRGFLPAERLADIEDVTGALRRAIVESFALRMAGKPLSEISAAEPSFDLTTEVELTPTATGATLQFTEAASLEDIVLSLAPKVDETATKENPTESEEDVAADRSTVDPLEPEHNEEPIDETAVKEQPTESEEMVAADRSSVDSFEDTRMDYEAAIETWGSEWYKVSLADPEIKFAVIKRVMQLTGVRISDHAIQSSGTAYALLTRLATPPKSRKLVDDLAAKEQLMTLPNVSVFAKRVTPIDKERMAGRWKLIEAELEKRGLPITGR